MDLAAVGIVSNSASLQSWIILIPLFSAINFNPLAPSLLEPDNNKPQHFSFKMEETDSKETSIDGLL